MKTYPIPLLLYHEIGTSAGATPPSTFRAHMAYLHRQGIVALSLTDFEEALSDRHLPAMPSVLITFDDGSRTCLTEALPILEEFDFRATAFLITDRMCGGDSGLGAYGNALTWDEVRALQASGRFAIQSHSHTHSRWPFDETGQVLVKDELRKSREKLAVELHSSIDQFEHVAWPWGRCNQAFETIAEDVGFKYQYLVQRGAVVHSNSKIRLPRLCCDGMSAASFSRWIDTLTTPSGAQIVNHAFGAVRRLRHGMAYQ
jgi:peptidoglycan/xylan/chitin deacetylase (PgdA/CDA1 family)